MANEDVTLGEVHRLVLDIRTNMVTRETNDVVISGLKQADTDNANDIKDTRIELAAYKATMEQNARQIRTLWLTWALGIAGTIATGLILSKVTGLW